ncbi:GEVED domain-containing protein, partial [Anaerorhabdus sp.]|uniref:GEVED domain-containing protein n=1 Tax=Anaerorhabdus sp. TaxID=1872524 RepID=UPI002FCB714F
AYQNTNADGDDIGQGIQDDGLATWPQYQQGSSTYSLNFQYTNDLGINSNVYGWIDWNRDGIFQLNEMANFVVVAPSSTINPQNSVLSFTVPSNTMVAGNITYARIRITTDTLINSNGGANQEDTRSLGPASDGEVEDYLVTVTLPPLDFGDAPDTGSGNGMGNYSTLLANNGPRHFFSPNLLLGTQVTTEADAYQNTNADGDDIGQGIQDDGLATWPQINQGVSNYSLSVSYTNAIGSTANIYGWIDFNKDGIFQLEESATTVIMSSSTTNPRTVSLNFTVPSTSTLVKGDITYARLRITTNNLLNTNSSPNQEDTRSLGLASDGEVEDYLVIVLPPYDFGDAPDINAGNGNGNYSTLLSNNGPRHQVNNNLKLGSNITIEADAYENTNADGDDIGKSIQDDGLTSWPIFYQGITEKYFLDLNYTNYTGVDANIYAWIDWNRDGVFQLNEAANPLSVPSYYTNTRKVTLEFDLPPGTFLNVGDDTYIRIRITTDTLVNTNGGASQEDTRSLGAASDGEVEDYLVTVQYNDMDYGDAPDISSGNGTGDYTTRLANNGPRHFIVDGLKLGGFITAEVDGYENATATGDDLSKGIQDDGISPSPPNLVIGDSSYKVNIGYINSTGNAAYIYAWLDWNRDGIFQLSEINEVTITSSTSINPRSLNLIYNKPANLTLADGEETFLRVRLTTEKLINKNSLTTQEDTRSIGLSQSGEVEDYLVNIIDLNINGVIWYDLNCDGIQNPGEPLAGNVVVELYSTNNPSVAIESTTTDNLGKYSFPGLPQGTYFVKVKLPNGYEFTISKVGINPNIDSDVDKETGQSAALILNQYNKTHVVDAGLCKLNNISGYAFYDCNSDGILNSNESLLCGVVFNLFDMNNNQIATTTTNCDGKYEFNNISPGTYTVKTISPSGMNLTTQNSSYYGSKPNINGVFTTTLTNTDYSEGFAGFRGTLGQTVKYCVTCNNNNNNTSFCS